MSLKDVQVEDMTEQVSLDFGFKAEYVEGFKTISGKEPKETDGCLKYTIQDFDIGNKIEGYPEITIFDNNDKDDEGKYEKNYQSIRLRLFDDTIDDDEPEYIDLYANIPRRNDNGVIKDINKFFGFYRGGFDLIFSFMRFFDETNVVTEKGEEINKINGANIENICKYIDMQNRVNVKVVKGASEDYPSWIILNMEK